MPKKLNNSWRPTDLLELIHKKDVLFIIGDQNAKIGSQEIPGITGKFGLGVQNEAGQSPMEFCQEKTLVIPNTLLQQHKKGLYTWTSPEGQYWNYTDYILCNQKWRSSIQSAKTRPGADCGSNLLLSHFSRVWLLATPWTSAYQAPPSMGFSRPE